MVTRVGEKFLYEGVSMGWAKDPENDDQILLIATDKDNEEMHMFPIAMDKFEQFIAIGKQTAAGQKIEVFGANEMPKGAPQDG